MLHILYKREGPGGKRHTRKPCLYRQMGPDEEAPEGTLVSVAGLDHKNECRFIEAITFKLRELKDKSSEKVVAEVCSLAGTDQWRRQGAEVHLLTTNWSEIVAAAPILEDSAMGPTNRLEILAIMPQPRGDAGARPSGIQLGAAANPPAQAPVGQAPVVCRPCGNLPYCRLIHRPDCYHTRACPECEEIREAFSFV